MNAQPNSAGGGQVDRPSAPHTTLGWVSWRFLGSAVRVLAPLSLVLTLTILPSSTGAQRPNGAGVVIRHGDGTLIYVYVQFEEESITGEELLVRTGLDLTFAPFGGLGAGVCRIQNEGCPADDCYCHSYTTPAYFWHYYTYQGGEWVEAPFGASSREVRDGDIDGWSWTSGDHGLPPVTIDEIAAINGVDRNPPTPTESPSPTPTPQLAPPTPTDTPAPPPTSTPAPEPTATVTPLPDPSPTSTATPVPQSDPTATVTFTATSTAASASTATSTPTLAQTSRAATSPEVTATSTPLITSRAVIVRPSATPEVLEVEEDGGGPTSFVLFGALAAGVVIAGAGAMLYRRKGGS